ncbi:pyridoxine/pyridoxamine 5'-phosphate oxidase [Nocardioides mangrovi]|uniref:Pyridoxamine 5'-phosphate oxidase family protein n=1 Tax=Nocardioides mangrovi TaxID=2874580 RepID=A0ABS7UCE0_9ACTN|nr:pyridoxamine 5'-phosphate oxidase family protein [Nocardioides mangrovi]MBZ5738452.1 pyridoxamine 5'-phosphate oxidase family protein [Nocardioides mangrovi]
MTEAPADPFELLTEWLPGNDDPVRPLMTLATTSVDGWPAARTVLLSEYDGLGFWFHTDSRSDKIAEVDRVPRAALVIHLPAIARQVVVQGTVVPADPAEEVRAYNRRSAYLKVLAWLNDADLAARPLPERQERWAAFCAEHPPESLTPSATWTGRCVRPERLVLWWGREDAASRRVVYTRAGEGWSITVRPG